MLCACRYRCPCITPGLRLAGWLHVPSCLFQTDVLHLQMIDREYAGTPAALSGDPDATMLCTGFEGGTVGKWDTASKLYKTVFTPQVRCALRWLASLSCCCAALCQHSCGSVCLYLFSICFTLAWWCHPRVRFWGLWGFPVGGIWCHRLYCSGPRLAVPSLACVALSIIFCVCDLVMPQSVTMTVYTLGAQPTKRWAWKSAQDRKVPDSTQWPVCSSNAFLMTILTPYPLQPGKMRSRCIRRRCRRCPTWMFLGITWPCVTGTHTPAETSAVVHAWHALV